MPELFPFLGERLAFSRPFLFFQLFLSSQYPFHNESLGKNKCYPPTDSLFPFPQPSHSWVTVHNLKQLDGGILDPDDRLNDVADDREQIIALYEEQPHEHQGGDGTSASSDSENPSPDIFQVRICSQARLGLCQGSLELIWIYPS